MSKVLRDDEGFEYRLVTIDECEDCEFYNMSLLHRPCCGCNTRQSYANRNYFKRREREKEEL